MVSLFTGAGGLDIGLEEAGFRTVSALDVDPACTDVLRQSQAAAIPVRSDRRRRYLAGTNVLCDDVTTLNANQLKPANADLFWTPDIMCGGPPCQPFSSAGNMAGLDDPRGRLFEHFVRLADALRPRFLLFENVRGLVTMTGPAGQPGEAIAVVRQAFESIGYAVRFALLNAADYGAPQRRVRCFMIGSRVGPPPLFPPPTHSRHKQKGRRPWMTLGEFLDAHPELAGKNPILPSADLAPLLANVPAGSGLKSAGAREPTRPGGHWGYKQGTFIADQSLPARTVTTSSADWIRQPDGSLRRLTWQECAGLQGFPPEWRFGGSAATRQRLVGNAVPVVFGRVLGRVLLDALAGRNGATDDAPVFPTEFTSAIAYTKREHARNRAARLMLRARQLEGCDVSEAKGLGSSLATAVG